MHERKAESTTRHASQLVATASDVFAAAVPKQDDHSADRLPSRAAIVWRPIARRGVPA